MDPAERIARLERLVSLLVAELLVAEDKSIESQYGRVGTLTDRQAEIRRLVDELG